MPYRYQSPLAEWLETNGLGGWASSTVSGENTRGYHGVLVAATTPPTGRQVLLSRLDETAVVAGRRVELSTRRYVGATSPEGFRYLRSFDLNPFPSFDYESEDVTLRKKVVAIHGANTTVVLYELLRADGPVVLELRPFVAGRDYHGRVTAGPAPEIALDGEALLVRCPGGILPFSIAVRGARFVSAPDWHYRFEYVEELARGLSAREDLFTPGYFQLELCLQAVVAAVVTSEADRSCDGVSLVTAEAERRKQVAAAHAERDRFAQILCRAASQFIVRRGSKERTIIAGYHWFTDWGRDTMIALPGVCLATGRWEDAKSILREYARVMSQGMLPNRFPDAVGEVEYNTVDGTLWYFIAIYKYLQYTDDLPFVGEELLPVMQEILAWHIRGTRYGIGIDADGLLIAGTKGTQLTWMDARIDETPVTSRFGKAVEINALWYNALRVLEVVHRRMNDKGAADEVAGRARRVQVEFNRLFWNGKDPCLYDCINEDGPDRAIRPNQILAIGLPFPLLDTDRAAAVLAVVDRELLTPRGLRSLSPQDPNYCPRYEGEPRARDSAYHQGTVWPWLLGPYCTAVVRFRGEAGRVQARALLRGFAPHFDEAGLGTVSEIFDGDPPYAPRGCIAQAWSVGELLRSYVEDVCAPHF